MRAAVLGSPIEHSLSPLLHRAAYAAMGLDGWRYDAFEVDEAGLPAFLASLTGPWAGLSLTMPLKRAVLPLLDSVSATAAAVGGANTVVFRDGAAHGENTDVHGIERALTEAGLAAPAGALVLGGGATAASALAALRGLGAGEVTLAVREPARAGETLAVAERLGMAPKVRRLDETAAPLDVELVVSTLPALAADAYAGRLARVPAFFDVVYSPWPTRAALAVRRAGGTVIGGFEMLLHQAVRQVELMTGGARVPVAAMRAAGTAELVRRAG